MTNSSPVSSTANFALATFSCGSIVRWHGSSSRGAAPLASDSAFLAITSL